MINRLLIEGLTSIKDNLILDSTFHSGVTNSYEYSKINKFRDSIVQLEKWNLFSTQISEIKKTKLYQGYYLPDSLSVNSTENSSIQSLTTKLYYKVLGVIEAFPEYDIQDTSTSLIAKYHTVKDFAELEKFSKELKVSIQLPLQILANQDKELELQSIEDGSIVLTISFGTGIYLITKILNLAFQYKAKWEEAKRNEEYTKSLAIDVSVKETISNAMNDQVKKFLEVESEVLVKESINNDDREKILIVKNSVTTLFNLLNNGLTIQPSLKASSDIQNQFKNFTALESKEQKKLNESNT